MDTRDLTASCLLSTLLLFCAHTAANDLGEGLANGAPSSLLKNASKHHTQWNGIGKMFWDDIPACTVSLLDTRDQQNKATGPAYVLTAAHCVFSVAAPTYEPAMKESVQFDYFNDTLHISKRYAIKRTVWNEYRQTDLAIMELDASLSTVLEDGVTPLRLASEWSGTTRDVLVIGAPEELPEAGLRMAACTQSQVDAGLVEGDRVYHNAVKNRCQDIRSGSSGSPVLDRASGRILSVMTSSTFGAEAQEQCFENAPCEVKDGQPHWSANTHYAQPVDYLSGCLPNSVFTDVANACAPYRTFEVTDVKFAPTQYVAMPEQASDPEPVLEAEFTLSTPDYRFKTVRDPLQCTSPHHYSDAIDGKDAAIKTPIARETGMHFLCIIGVQSAQQRSSVELMKSAWIIPAQLIARTPVPMPVPTVTLTSDWNYTVEWQYRVPTHFGTHYYAGPQDATVCDNVAPEAFTQTYDRLAFRAEQLPLTLCSRNQDMTGRLSEVRSDPIALP